MARSWSELRSDPRLVRLAQLQREVEQLAAAADISTESRSVLADQDWTQRVLRRVSSQYTIFVLGQVSSGKSSLINALLGRKLLQPSGDPTDGVVSVLLPADESGERAERVDRDGRVVRFANVGEGLRFLRQQETSTEAQLACREVRLFLNEPVLRTFRVVNTPGLGDRLAAFEEATLRYLAEDESDLVLWTFFPDTTANEQELKVFGHALARRRGTVLGVISHCMQGHEDEPTFDPQADPALADVEHHLRKHLGDYLSDVLRFDSHIARRLNEKVQRDARVALDPDFINDSARCGRTALEKTLTNLLPDGVRSVEGARVESLLRRCVSTAHELENVAREAEARATRNAGLAAAEVDAWKKLETTVLAPARARLRQSLRDLAAERAGEMVDVMGNAAHDAILEHFGLAETLFRSLASYTPWCDSMGDKLTGKVGEAVQDTLDAARFFVRLSEAADDVVREHMEALGRSLDAGLIGEGGPVDAVRVPADAVLGQALSGPVKALAASFLKHAMTKVEEQLAKRAAEQAAEQAARVAATKATKGAAEHAGKAAAAKAAQQAGQQAAQRGALATLGTALSVVGLVLLPLDLRKLYTDFQKGKDHAAKQVKQRYVASRGTYEVRLFDALWPAVQERLTSALAEGRREANAHGEASRRWTELAERAAAAAVALCELQEAMHLA